MRPTPYIYRGAQMLLTRPPRSAGIIPLHCSHARHPAGSALPKRSGPNAVGPKFCHDPPGVEKMREGRCASL